MLDRIGIASSSSDLSEKLRLDSSVELNQRFHNDVEDKHILLNAETVRDSQPLTISLGESLLNRLLRDKYVGTFLLSMSVVWPELTMNQQSNICIRFVQLMWYALVRLCGILFIVGVICLTIYEEIIYSEPEGIDVVNYSLSLASTLQVVSLYPVLYICNQKLSSKASDESIPIELYRKALVPSMLFFVLVAISSMLLLVMNCYHVEYTPLVKLVLGLRFIQAVFQIFLGGVLSVNIMFMFVDSYLLSSAIDDISQQISDETVTIDQLESIRQNLKRNQLSSLRVNHAMSGIAVINLLLFVLSMFFLSTFRFGACIDNSNFTLIFSIFFKEVFYLLTVLIAVARINEHGDRLLITAGSMYSSTSEKQLTRTVIYISLQTNPLSFTILGMRPTYTKLALQGLTFVVATVIGIGRSIAVRSA